MPNNSISIDIVEEILQAEEAKSENKSMEHEQSKSDSSESLMGYLNDFMSIKTTTSTSTSASNMPVSTPCPSPQLLNLNRVKTEGKAGPY